jgi:hypothetical protein
MILGFVICHDQLRQVIINDEDLRQQKRFVVKT